MAAFQIPAVFTAIDRLTSPMRKMGRGVKGFANKSILAIERLNRSFGRLNKRLKTAIGLGGGFAVAFAVGQGARAFLDLDKNISAAAAKFQIFDRQSDAFIKLKRTAERFGETTEFTAGQAAEALKNLATAGFSAEQAMVSLPRVLDLATAAQQDLATTSDVAAKTLAAFGLKSKDAEVLDKNLVRVSDTLNKIITTSGFGNLPEFLDVIAQSGSGARAAGVDIETWGAVVASSVSEAVPASKAGTRFANMLSFMTKNLKTFNKMGIQVADNNGDYRDFVDIMTDVQKKTAGLGSVKKASVLIKLFGDRGAKMAASLLENGIPAIEKYRESLRNAEGITKKMAEFMRSGISGGVKAMQSAFESVTNSIGNVFQPEIDRSIKSLTELARGAKTWIKENKTMIKTLLKIVVFLGKAFFWFKVLTAAIFLYNVGIGLAAATTGTFSIALVGNTVALAAFNFATKVAAISMGIFNAIMTANPIGLVIVAIAALIGLLVLAAKNWDKWGAALSLFLGPLGLVLSMIMSFKRNWELISQSFKTGGILSGIKSIALAIADGLLQPIEQLLILINKFTGKDLGIGTIAGIRQTISLALDNAAGVDGDTAPVNPTATRERALIERSESVEEQRIKMIVESDRPVSIEEDETVGVAVQLPNTFDLRRG